MTEHDEQASAHQARPVRCPSCDKLIAEALKGELTFVCPRCKQRSTVTH